MRTFDVLIDMAEAISETKAGLAMAWMINLACSFKSCCANTDPRRVFLTVGISTNLYHTRSNSRPPELERLSSSSEVRGALARRRPSPAKNAMSSAIVSLVMATLTITTDPTSTSQLLATASLNGPAYLFSNSMFVNAPAEASTRIVALASICFACASTSSGLVVRVRHRCFV